MIPDNCNLPQNAKWTDFDDDYTAGEREELEELKRKWEDGLIDSRDVVVSACPFMGNQELDAVGWYDRAKEILRGVL